MSLDHDLNPGGGPPKAPPPAAGGGSTPGQAPGPRPAPLEEALARRDLILVTGKGGTGKSTLVAALAEMAARRRGAATAVEFSAHPRLPELLGPGSPVTALDIEAEKVVGASLGRLLKLPALANAVLGNRVLKLFIRTSPAIREMVALDELSHVVEGCAARGTPVIADLPATGHALSFLDTPRSVHRMLRVGPLAGIARRVEELILDGRRTELVAVALPEELPVNETIELVRKAGQIGVACRIVVVNQTPSSGLHAGDRELLEALERHSEGEMARFAGGAQSELDGSDQARALIERLRAAVPVEVLELPRYAAQLPRACVDTVIEALSR